MLAAGEIDALYTARAPSCFRRGDPSVKRLFTDFVAIEREYFRRTGIFPIMHTVVIRRDVYEDEPWIAQSLYKALRAAQRETYADLLEIAALKAMLPWLVAHVEETRREMGEDYFGAISRYASSSEQAKSWSRPMPETLKSSDPLGGKAVHPGLTRSGHEEPHGKT